MKKRSQRDLVEISPRLHRLFTGAVDERDRQKTRPLPSTFPIGAVLRSQVFTGCDLRALPRVSTALASTLRSQRPLPLDGTIVDSLLLLSHVGTAAR